LTHRRTTCLSRLPLQNISINPLYPCRPNDERQKKPAFRPKKDNQKISDKEKGCEDRYKEEGRKKSSSKKDRREEDRKKEGCRQKISSKEEGNHKEERHLETCSQSCPQKGHSSKPYF
ncbi:hypothetical protein OAA12_00205, partial [Akkermansiaceae bacterium]|nr:hypothetical protein [Akkermansiaceae bacterium]